MMRRVLVLDHDPGFRLELEHALQRLGHESAVFARWSEALEEVERDPGLGSVVTELSLGDGPNGVSFARMARRRRPDVQFAFLTNDEALATEVDPGLGPVFLKNQGAERIAIALAAAGLV